jgi:hypothetical protein
LQIGHQPVDAAGDVVQMKSSDLFGGEPIEAAAEVFARLLEAEE